MCEKSETAGGEPAACHCEKPCTTCSHSTGKPNRAQAFYDSIGDTIRRYVENEQRRQKKPTVIYRPLRRNGYRGKR